MSTKTPYTIPSRLNLTIDDDFREILLVLKSKYPLLKEIDLIKMAVSGYFTERIDEYEEELDEAASHEVKESLRDYKQGNYKTFNSVDKLMEYLNEEEQ